MFDRFFSIIKKIVPQAVFKKIQRPYHWFLAKLAALIYFYPSEKMIIVGVTGTTGKSSTCYFIAQVLESAGFKVGMTTTTLFKIRDKEWLNDKKMTMLGRFTLQKLLRQMVSSGCSVAVVETTSQGIEQFRHIGINWDILVFTNLYPEHIEAHGSFELYKCSKGKLFQRLSSCVQKNIKSLKHPSASLRTCLNTKTLRHKDILNKTIIVNLDDEHAGYFLSFKADKKVGYTRNKEIKKYRNKVNDVILDNENLKINLLGSYNRDNVLAAFAIAKSIGLDEEIIRRAVEKLKPLPGRLEFIENNLGIKILVDYAFEPKALEKVYETIKNNLEYKKIIHVLGSCGGGRDKSRRPVMGKIAAENADIIIVTNEDPYDELPEEIIEQVAEGAKYVLNSKNDFQNHKLQISNYKQIPNSKPKIQNLDSNLYKIFDRRQAIHQALSLAKIGDLILITGKGAEQAICVENGKKIKWDDREVVREEIKKVIK